MVTCKNKKICILGNYSGRNAGDTAILAGILREVSAHYKNVEFLIPTLSPLFIKNTFAGYPVKPVNILPWRGCIKFLGIPVWNALCSSDLILITDAILFDRGLFNPIHNYLSTLGLMIPLVRARNIPVVLYNVSIGPVRTALGQTCLKRVVRNSDVVIVRDDESLDILRDTGPIQVPIVRGADSALSAETCSSDRVRELLHNRGISCAKTPRIGINLNSYGYRFVKGNHSGSADEKLVSVLSQVAAWIRHEVNADVWLFGTQHMDITILENLRKRMGTNGDDKVHLFTNRQYNFAELTCMFSLLDLLVGMRTHSIILASSVGTPVIGIVNYPKTQAYLRRIGLEDQGISIEELEFGKLRSLVRNTLEHKCVLREKIVQKVEEERRLAWKAAENLAPFLEG